MDGVTNQYDEKVLEMQRYIPVLLQMIAKLESDQDGEGKESQLSKMRMLHQLLTKNEKKLKLETLVKCEAVLKKIGRKLNKDSSSSFDGRKSHAHFSIDDLAAPASPQDRDNFSHFHSPIVIPTERKSSPSKGEYRRRTENDQKSRHSEKPDCSDNKQHESNSELFRRRSPATRWDRPPKSSNSSEDRAYSRRSPVSKKDSYSETYRNPDRPDKNFFDRRPQSKSPDFDKRKNKSVHEDSNFKNSPALEQLKAKVEPKRVPTPLSEVLRSPPLSANDIVDLLNESEESEEQKEMKAMDKLNAVRKKLHNEIINSKKRAQDSPVRNPQEPPIRISQGPPLVKTVQEPPMKIIPDPRLRTMQDASAKTSSESCVKTTQEPPNKIVQEPFAKTLVDSLAFKQRKDTPPPAKHDIAPSTHFTHIQRPNLKQIIPNNNFESQPPTKDNYESQKSDSQDHSNQPSIEGFEKKQAPRDPRERKEDPSNVRLAYKYNPHPRKNVEMPKNIELPSTSQATSNPLLSPISPGGNNVAVNKPTVNTLPGVNLADPRLRNRSMNFMMPDKNCPSSNQMDMKMSSSVFLATDNRRPLTPHSLYPAYGGYNQQIPPQPVPPPNVPNQISHHTNHHIAPLPPLPVPPPSSNLLPQRPPNRPLTQNLNMMSPKMNHHPVGGSSTAYNKFQPAMNDQVERMKYMESKKHRNEPKTYGEYRQAKLAEQKLKEAPKSSEQNQSPAGQKTPVDSASSCLDKVYRNSNYNLETPLMSSFKIPKLKKEELTDSNKSKQEEQKIVKEESPAVVEIKKEKTSKEELYVPEVRKKEKISKEKHPVVEEVKKERGPRVEIKREKLLQTEAKSSKTESKDDLPKGSEEDAAPKNEVQAKQKPKKEKYIKEEKQKVKTSDKPPGKVPEKGKQEKAVETSPSQIEDSSRDEQKVEENTEKVEESTEENDHDEQEFIENFKKYGRVRRPNFIVTSTTDSCEVSTQNILTGKRTRNSLPAQTEGSSSKDKEKENVQNKRKTLPATISDTESVGKEISERAPRSRTRPKKGKKFKNVAQVNLNDNVEEKHEDCVVSSTTAGSNEEMHKEVVGEKAEPKKEDGKEWLEGFLSNITNPALNKEETVLNILEKVLDEDKLKQIKDILANSHEEFTTANEGKETSVLAPVEEEDKNSGSGPKTTETKEHHKKKKTELDRLNEDIRDMFISEGVLTATGKRMCTILTEEKKRDEHPVASKTPEPVKGAPTNRKLAGRKPVKKMGKRGRKLGSGKKGRKQKKTPEIVLEEDYDSSEEPSVVNTSSITEGEDMPPPILTPQVKKAKNRSYKPCPKSKRKFFFESDKESSESEPEVIFEVNTDHTPERYEEQAEIIEEQFEIIEDEKSDVLDNFSEGSSDKFITSFKNTNEKWHSKSDAAKRCIICSFAGEKMGNHYIRSHPEIEFPIARLPPHALKSLKEGVSATNARKKGSNWQHQCSFCTTTLTLSLRDWTDHYSSHTGEYAYKCSECDKRFDASDSVEYHVKLQCPDGRVIYLAQFERDESSISGHICDLCGYIQMSRDAVVKHLKIQHNEVKEALTKVTLMTCEAQEKKTKRNSSLNSKLDESQIEVFMPKQNDVNLDPNFIKYMKDVSFSTASTSGNVGPTKPKSLSIVDQLSEMLKKSTDKAKDGDVVEVPAVKTMSDVVLIDDTDDESENNSESSKATETQIPTETLGVVQDKPEESAENTPLVSMADRLCQRFSAAKSPSVMEQDSQCPSSVTIADTQIQRFTTTVEDEDQTGEAESVVYVVEIVDELIGKADHVKEAEAIKLPRNKTLSEMLSLRLMKESSALLDSKAKSTLNEDNDATPQVTTPSTSNISTTENSGLVKTPSKTNTEVQSNSWVGMSLVERLSQRLKSVDGKSFDKESESNSPQPIETIGTRESPKEKGNDESNHDADSSFEGELVIDESAVSDEGIRAEDVRSTNTISSMNTQTESVDGVCEDQNADEVQDDDNWEDIEVIGSETASKDDAEVAAKKNKAKKNELIISAFSRLYKLAKTSDRKDKGKKSQKSGKKSPETTQNKSKEVVEQSDLSQADSETPTSTSEPIPVVSEAPSENNEAALPVLTMSEEHLPTPNDLIDTINLDNVVDLSMPQNDLHDLSELLDLPATEDPSNMVIVLSDEGEATEDDPIVSKLPVIESCVSLQTADKDLSSTNTSFNAKDPSNEPNPLDDAKAKSSRGSPVMNRIDNMGFSKTTEGLVKYQCLVESCSFLYSEMPFGLESHVLNEHRNLLWKGYCYSCEAQVCSDEIMQLSQEYKHMMDVHVNSNQNERNESGNTTPRPFIKVRNISDLLSNPEQEKGNSQNGDKGIVPEKLPELEVAKQKILNNLPTSTWMPPLKVTITSITTEPFSAPSFEDGKTAVTSPSSELKISSVSSNVNQDFIHNSSANSGGFLKIAEVVSLAKLPASKADEENCKQPPPQNTTSKPIATKPQILKVTQNKITKSSSLNLLNLSVSQGGKEKDPRTTSELIQDMESLKNAAKILKPWRETISYKSQEVADQLLTNEALFSFFKCMGYNCSFFTNSAESMRTHINHHNETVERNGTPFDSKLYQFRECPYCSYNRQKQFLVEHMTHVHGEDIYQCPYCFYRACVAYSVVTHCDAHHKGLPKQVLVAVGKQKTLHKEIRNMAKLRRKNVRPIGCWDCNKIFYIIRNYTKHLLQHNSGKSTFTCWMCRSKVMKTRAEKHLSMMHSIAVYECIYCSYSTNVMNQMRVHIANLHPSHLSYMCVRVAPDKNFDTTEETLETSTVLANLGEPLGDVPLIKNLYTDSELNIKDPLVLGKGDVRSSKSKPSSPEKDMLKLACNILKTENTEKAERFRAGNTQLVERSKAEHAKRIERFRIGNPQIVETTKEVEVKDSSNPQTEPEVASRERMYLRILEAAKEMVEGTGIEPDELYKCIKCGTSYSTERDFTTHIQQHIRASDLEDLKCACRKYSIKNWSSYELHLRWHAVHHYFCYFCNHTGPTTNAISRHINDVHQKVGMVPVPLILGLKNKNKDFFVVAPKNIKQASINQFTERMVRTWERKKALNKKSFTPDELDLLPRQAIFVNPVHCQVCNYRTKVRTNMFRHLLFHKQEIKVASVDPVNPVPCLNSNERHFDKMVNLACSSNITKDGVKSGTKEEPKLLEFIPAIRRYVCGVPNCTYLTISKNMLKWHLNALHLSEQTYVCPHCKVEVCKKSICLEKIFNHLKFHESRLHVCEECNYTHHKRFIVDRHVNEKHPGQNCEVITYTRLGTNTIKTNESIPIKPVPNEEDKRDLKWECGLCKIRKATSQQISFHVSRAHNVKHRYQCVHCDFGGLYINIMKHMAERHPTKVQEVKCMFYNVNDLTEKALVDHTTPIWRRDPARVKNIRGILMEDEEESRRNLRLDDEDHDDTSQITQSSKSATSTPTRGPTPINKFTENSVEVVERSKKESGVKRNRNELIRRNSIKTYGKSCKQLKKSETNSDLNMSCKKCAFLTTNPDDYQNHLKNFNHDDLILATAGFSFLCYHCTFSANSIYEVRQHWEEEHANENGGEGIYKTPFWFRMVPQVCCGRCNYKHEIFSVLRHNANAHPGYPPALLNYNNNKMCGQCFYVYTDIDDLAKHYQEDHKQLMYSTFTVSNELLEKLMMQGYIQKLTAIKCLRCNCVLAEQEFEKHVATCEPNMPRLFEHVHDEVMHLCFQCKFVGDEETVIKHLSKHRFKYVYKCFACQAEHKFFDEFVEHLDKAHNTAPNQFTITRCIKNKIKKLLEMTVIFPNGLVLKKSQLLGTIYGDDELITKAAKDEFSKYLKPGKRPLPEDKEAAQQGPPKSKIRLDDTSEEVSKNIEKDKRKAFQITSKDTESSKHELNDSSQDVSKNIPRKRSAPEKVDLSKIFTVMNFGGKQVPISCDRFAKLVKINVRVRIEKINMSKYLTGSSTLKRRSRSPSRDASEPNKKPKID